MANLLRWLPDEAKHKTNSDFTVSSWTQEHRVVPSQGNHCDCGVFALVFANYLGINRAFDFDCSVGGAITSRVRDRVGTICSCTLLS